MLYQLGKYIKSQRIRQGLNRQKLAAKLGYKNLNKGARRIEKLEKGHMSDGIFKSISAQLNLSEMEINAAIQQDRDAFEKWVDAPVPRELIIRWLAAVYARYELPENIQTDEEAIAYAKFVAQEYKRKACLILNRRWTYWIKPDGSGFRKETTFKSPINTPSIQIQGDNKKFLLSFGNKKGANDV